MTTHRFELIAAGAFDDDTIDALFDAGCDDALVGEGIAGTLELGFDRDADSLQDAIMTAIADVESVPGLRVLRVGPDELVYASEIAERVGRTRQSIDMLVRGQRGPGTFPSPVTGTARNPLWRWSDVATWFADYTGDHVADRHRTAVIAATNGLLEARKAMAELPVATRRRLRTLVA